MAFRHFLGFSWLLCGTVAWWLLSLGCWATAQTEAHEGEKLAQLAMQAVVQADWESALEFWLQRLVNEPDNPAPLAHLALFQERLGSEAKLWKRLQPLASRDSWSVESRELLTRLLLDLACRLGKASEAAALAQELGVFRSWLRLSVPRAGFHPIQLGRQPTSTERWDSVLATPQPLPFNLDQWLSHDQTAILWGGFSLQEETQLRLALHGEHLAALFLDGQPVAGLRKLPAGRDEGEEVYLQLPAGDHSLLLVVDRRMGAEDWSVRLQISPWAGIGYPKGFLPWRSLESQSFPELHWPLDLPPLPEPLPVEGATWEELDYAALLIHAGKLAEAEDRLAQLWRPSTAEPVAGLYLNELLSRLLQRGKSRLRLLQDWEESLERLSHEPAPLPLALQQEVELRLLQDDMERSLKALERLPESLTKTSLKALWLHRFATPELALEGLQQAHSQGVQEPGLTLRLARLLESFEWWEQWRKLLLSSLETGGDHPALRQALAASLAEAGENSMALELCEHSPDLHSPSIESLCLGTVQSIAGEHESALKAYQEAVKQSPRLADAWKGLARQLEKSRQWDAADHAWRQSQRLNGKIEPRWAQLIPLLDVSYQEFAQPGPPHPLGLEGAFGAGASLVQLVDISLFDFDEEARFQEFYHGILRAWDSRGREQIGELELPADAELLWALVRLPDGSTLLPEQVQKDSSHQVVSFFGLEDGALVDYAWSRPWRTFEHLNQEFVFGATDLPLGLSRVCWLEPPLPFEERLGIKVHQPEELEAWNLLIGESQAQCYQKHWIEAVQAEPSMPELAGVLPSVSLFVKLSGIRLQRAIQLRILQAAQIPDRLVREAQELLLRLGQSPVDLHRFIRGHIQDGVGADDALDALRLGRGDAFLRVSLARVLWELSGLPTSIGLSLDGHPISGLPREPVHLGGLVLAPGADFNGQGAAWTFRRPWLHPDALDSTIQGRPLVLLKASGLEFLQLPATTLAQDTLRFELDIYLKSDGEATARGQMQATGVLAETFRQLYSNSGGPERFVPLIATTFLPTLALNSAQVQGDSAEIDTFALEFSGQVSHFLNPSPPIRFQPLLLPGALSELASQLHRQYPLLLTSYPMSEKVEIRYHLEPGLEVTRLPRSHLAANSFGLYSLDYSLRPDGFVLSRTAAFPPQTIPEEEYPAFRQMALDIDQAEAQQAELRILPEP